MTKEQLYGHLSKRKVRRSWLLEELHMTDEEWETAVKRKALPKELVDKALKAAEKLESKERTSEICESNVWMMCNAIIEQAVRDYRFSLNAVKATERIVYAIKTEYDDDTLERWWRSSKYSTRTRNTSGMTQDASYWQHEKTKRECEEFFRGGWMQMLTDIDGRWLLRTLEKEDRSGKTYVRKYMGAKG